MIYYSISISLIIISFLSLYVKHSRRFENSLFLFYSVIMIGMAALRNFNLGIDTGGYLMIYNRVNLFRSKDLISSYYSYMNDSGFTIEPMYYVINYFASSFEVVLLVSALIGVGLKCYFIWKYCDYKFVVLTLYFCHLFIYLDMGVMRQGIASSFLLFALIKLKDNKYLHFCMYVILACSFHLTSTLVFVPIVFWIKVICLYNIRIPITIVFAFFSLLLPNISNIFNKIALLLNLSVVSMRVTGYASRSAALSVTSYIKPTLFLLIFLYAYYVKKVKDKDSHYWLDTYWYGYFVQILFRGSDFVATRGILLYYFCYSLVIDKIIVSDKKRKQLSSIITILFIAYYFYQMLLLMYGTEYRRALNMQYEPYKTYFQ